MIAKLNAVLAQVLALPAARDFFARAPTKPNRRPSSSWPIWRTTYDQWADTIRKLEMTKQ